MAGTVVSWPPLPRPLPPGGEGIVGEAVRQAGPAPSHSSRDELRRDVRDAMAYAEHRVGAPAPPRGAPALGRPSELIANSWGGLPRRHKPGDTPTPRPPRHPATLPEPG